MKKHDKQQKHSAYELFHVSFTDLYHIANVKKEINFTELPVYDNYPIERPTFEAKFEGCCRFVPNN